MKTTKILAPTIVVALIGSVAFAAPPVPQQQPAVPATPAAPPPKQQPIRPAGATPKLQRVTAAPEIVGQLNAKKKKQQVVADVGKVLSYQGNSVLLQIGPQKQVQIEPANLNGPSEPEIVAATQTLPVAMRKYSTYMLDWKSLVRKPPVFAVPNDAPTASRNDHRTHQSGVRDQASRNTCTAHAAVSALEARLRKKNAPYGIDLSENYAFNIFATNSLQSCTQDEGVPTWKTAAWLTAGRICTEAESPYQTTASCAGVPAACQSNKRHGFTSTFALFGKDGGGGLQSINNTNILESWIDAGYDIVGGFHLAGSDWSDGTERTGTIDVQMSGGSPADAFGGHAMVVVGYDKPGGYFILKNSWGIGWGHDGYAYVSYDYIQTYARYGYVVMETTNW